MMIGGNDFIDNINLEICKDRCLKDYECDVFNYHAEDRLCALRNCNGDVPEPKPYDEEGWNGYKKPRGNSTKVYSYTFPKICLSPKQKIYTSIISLLILFHLPNHIYIKKW